MAREAGGRCVSGRCRLESQERKRKREKEKREKKTAPPSHDWSKGRPLHRHHRSCCCMFIVIIAMWPLLCGRCCCCILVALLLWCCIVNDSHAVVAVLLLPLFLWLSCCPCSTHNLPCEQWLVAGDVGAVSLGRLRQFFVSSDVAGLCMGAYLGGFTSIISSRIAPKKQNSVFN